MADVSGLMDSQTLIFTFFLVKEGGKSFPPDRAVYMYYNMSLKPLFKKVESTNQARYPFWVNNPFTKSHKSLLMQNTVPAKDVWLMSSYAADM